MSLTKDQVRATMRGRRSAYPAGQVAADSRAITRRVLDLIRARDVQSVLAYAATAREVQTASLMRALWDLGKTVALPRIADRDEALMQAVSVRGIDELRPGPMGIPEPIGDDILNPPPDLILLPGLAFSTATGARLGRGAGYYDRYLAATALTAGSPAPLRVGLAFDFQLFDDLPTQPHDQPVDVIVTPTETHSVPRPG